MIKYTLYGFGGLLIVFQSIGYLFWLFGYEIPPPLAIIYSPSLSWQTNLSGNILYNIGGNYPLIIGAIFWLIARRIK